MPVERYRIMNPTLALLNNDGQHIAHTVPTGAFITLDSSDLLDGDKLIEVTWDGKKYRMFVEDLRLRAELMTDSHSSPLPASE
jgi:hemin uptake protein HemP